MTTQRGPVERAARRSVPDRGALSDFQAPLADLANSLARSLAQGPGIAAPPSGLGYRSTLLTLREVSGDRDAGADLLARLSAPLEHSEVPRAVDAGRPGSGSSGHAGDLPDALAAARRRRRPGTGP